VRRLRSLVLAGLVSMELVSFLSAGEAERTTAPLNFLFILVDDLGWSDLGCYGSDLHRTPHIDGLAGQGVRFTEAYAAAPVCTPTRAALMTGKYPARLHMTIWYEAARRPPTRRKLIPPVTVADLPHEEVTVAEVLHEAGYYTAHVGKWHLGDAAHYPETQGFDVNIGGTFWGAPQTFFYPYRGTRYFGGEYRYVPHLEFGQPGEYLTDRLTSEAIRVMRHARQQPFFLYLAYHTVHTPIEAKEEVTDHYARRIRPGMRHRNATYAAMVHSLDENVGRLLEELDRLDIARRTVVFLTSDNGGYINQFQGRTVTDNHPLRSGKGSLYEGGIRVPLIVRWPGVTPAGALCPRPVVTTDFYPTILEMAGLEGDPDHNCLTDGLSLVPLLKDPKASLPRRTLFWHYPHYYATTTPVSALRQDNWKLLEFHEDMHVELYDLAADPGERNDLAHRAPERVRALRHQLHRWRQGIGAQMPQPNSGK